MVKKITIKSKLYTDLYYIDEGETELVLTGTADRWFLVSFLIIINTSIRGKNVELLVVYKHLSTVVWNVTRTYKHHWLLLPRFNRSVNIWNWLMISLYILRLWQLPKDSIQSILRNHTSIRLTNMFKQNVIYDDLGFYVR